LTFSNHSLNYHIHTNTFPNFNYFPLISAFDLHWSRQFIWVSHELMLLYYYFINKHAFYGDYPLAQPTKRITLVSSELTFVIFSQFVVFIWFVSDCPFTTRWSFGYLCRCETVISVMTCRAEDNSMSKPGWSSSDSIGIEARHFTKSNR